MKDTKDPLKIFRENVAGSIEPSELDAIDEANTELVDSSVTEAKAAPVPDISDVDSDVYVSY